MPGVAEVAAPDGSLTRAETPLAALPSAVEIDQRSLALFRADIIGAAKRFRRYPRMALDSNWEGTTRIRIAFNKEGKRASIAVAQSSGHEILDRQAIDTITNAFVPLPPALRGLDFAIEIPVIYDLKDL